MSNENKNGNFAKPMLAAVDDFPTLPTVEFTEDDWNTVYRGCCIDSTFYSYLVRGDGYGTFWIPKVHVRLPN